MPRPKLLEGAIDELEPLSALDVIKEVNERLFHLTYVKNNSVQESQFIYFPSGIPKNVLIETCKRYCAKMQYRFVFIKPAILVINPEEM